MAGGLAALRGGMPGMDAGGGAPDDGAGGGAGGGGGRRGGRGGGAGGGFRGGDGAGSAGGGRGGNAAERFARMMEQLPAAAKKDIEKELKGKKIEDLAPEDRAKIMAKIRESLPDGGRGGRGGFGGRGGGGDRKSVV